MTTITETELTARESRLLQFIRDYQQRHDFTPSQAQMSAHMNGLPISMLRLTLTKLEGEGRIQRIGLRGIDILCDLPPTPPTPPPTPKKTAPAQPKPDPRHVPTAYAPPATLADAQRDCRLFWTASRLHMAENERLQKMIDRLQRTRPDGDTGRQLRRAELKIEELEAENARLKESARIAAAAWLTYARKFQTASFVI